jgi:hypothetical protein
MPPRVLDINSIPFDELDKLPEFIYKKPVGELCDASTRTCHWVSGIQHHHESYTNPRAIRLYRVAVEDLHGVLRDRFRSGPHAEQQNGNSKN